jgi:hypothetical protein
MIVMIIEVDVGMIEIVETQVGRRTGTMPLRPERIGRMDETLMGAACESRSVAGTKLLE